MFIRWFKPLTGTLILLPVLGCSDKAQFAAGVSGRNNDAAKRAQEVGVDPLSWEQRFPAAVFAETRLELGGDFSSALMTIPLASKRVDGDMEFKQRSLDTFEDTFKQGGLRQNLTETFQQNDLGILDIVLVVDNSHSMRQEQENLAARMAPLTSMINNTSWQIAITSTDPADGCVTNLIKANDADKEARFSSTILGLGVQGTRNEVGLYQARAALECQDPSWLRPGSNVAVIILSDEDNCSRGNDCGPYPESVKGSYLTDYLRSIRTPGVDAKVYGIIWEPGTSCPDGGFEAPIYQQVVRDTRGLTGNICSSDYTPILSAISKDIATTLKKQVSLAHLPSLGSVRVSVDGKDWTGQVTSNGTSIVFNKVPPANSQISITYQSEATPIVDRFVLTRAGVDPQTLEVLINGAQANDVRFNADDNSISFGSAPTADAEVRVRYSKLEALSRKFFIGKNILPESLNVRLDGSQTADFTYDKDDGHLVFGTPPSPLTRITIAYSRLEPQLSYPFMTPGITSMMVSLASNPDAPVNVTFAENKIILRPEDFREGDSLLISYESPVGEPGVITLPHAPHGDVMVVQGTRECAQDDLTLEGDRLWARCTLSQGEALIVSYRHVAALRRQFQLDVRDPDAYAWRVYLDASETKAFSRSGATIELQSDPPVSAMVRVRGERADR